MSLSIACEPLRVVVNPSRQELAFLIAAHGLGLWGILQSGFYVLLVGLVISVVYYLRRWFLHKGVQAVQLHNEYCWLECDQCTRQQYQLGKRHYVSGFLVIVQLRPLHQRFARSRYLAVFSDAVDTDTLRRLRVLLCLNQRTAPASSVVSE